MCRCVTSGSCLDKGNDRECNSITTYIRDIRSLVLSEFFVVAQEEDGVFQGQSVVKVTLGLSLCCALYLETEKPGKILNLSVCEHPWGINVHTCTQTINIKLAFFFFLLPVLPFPTRPGNCQESRQTVYPPQTWSQHDSSGSDRRTTQSQCTSVCDYDNALSNKPFNI